MGLIEDIAMAVQTGKAKQIKELVPQAIEEGHSAQEILNDGLLAGMSVIGDRFSRNEAFVPEVLVSARAMNKGTELIKPILMAEGAEPIGTAVIGTVQGDLHDIGKNIVKLMTESKNINVVDLGVDVAPEAFVQAVKDNNAKVCMCSALLTTTMPMLEATVKAFVDAGIRDQVKIMVGGAPVTQDYCNQIGADVFTVDGASAADACAKLILEA